jgi:mRNA-degrading endonuclease RelE of RelBE toxin-antitoxin system
LAVKLYPKAKRELGKLPKKVQRVIGATIDKMQEDITSLAITKLQGTPKSGASLYRVHATRDYVIIYAKDNGDILVARIADRKEAYEKLKKLGKSIKKYLA